MNSLYHFGDSYAGTGTEMSKHFVQHLSEIIDYEYKSHGVGGSCNEQILNTFLKNIFNYKSGDIVFFNFSFFSRGAYYDREHKKVMSGNYIVNDVLKEITKEGIIGREYVMGVLGYQLENNEDYNRKIFCLFDTIFEQLIKKNIKIYYIFIQNSEWSDDLLKFGTNIKFDNGFYEWLHEKGYHNHEECHYTKGIQKNITDHIIRVTPDLLSMCQSKGYNIESKFL